MMAFIKLFLGFIIWISAQCLVSAQLPETDVCEILGDVVFILDESSSIWPPDFKRQIQFVKDVIQNFDTQRGHTHVGALTFSNDTRLVFQLGQYEDKYQINSALDNIYQHGGGTRTDLALYVARNYMFAPDIRRSGVPQIAIIITDGGSAYVQKTVTEADFTKDAGVTIFAIGVGTYDFFEDELKRIASSPADDHYFYVDNYSSLNKIKDALIKKACHVSTTLPPPTTTPPQSIPGCSQVRTTDVIFGLSDLANARDTSTSVAFVKSLTSKMLIGSSTIQIGVTPRQCIEGNEVRLKDNDSPQGFKTSTSDRKIYGTRTDLHLYYLAQRGFKADQGARDRAAKIGVIIVDGPEADVRASVEAATRARAAGIHVIVVGVGRTVRESVLRDIAGNGQYVVRVNSYEQLHNVEDRLWRLICEALKGYKPRKREQYFERW